MEGMLKVQVEQLVWRALPYSLLNLLSCEHSPVFLLMDHLVLRRPESCLLKLLV